MDLRYTSQRAHPKNLGRIFCVLIFYLLTLIKDFKTSTLTFLNKILVLVHLVLVLLVTPE